MANSKLNKVTQNIIWGNVFVFVTSVMPFLVRTLIIHKWGMNMAGLNSLFSSVLNVLNISELGVGEALVYSLYKPMAEKNIKEANRLINLYKKIYFLIGICVVFVGLLLIPFIPYIISGEKPECININIVYLAFILNASVGYFIFSYALPIFQTNESRYILQKYTSISWAVIYIIQCIVIYYTRWYYVYIFLLPIGTLISQIINKYLANVFFPQYIPNGDVEKGFILDLVKKVGGMSIQKVRTAIRGSIDSVIISATLGLVILAKYQNYMMVMLVPQLLIRTISGAVLQSLGVSVATNSSDKNYIYVKTYGKIVQWIGMWFSTCLACLYHPFISLWIGETNSLENGTELFFALYFYVLNLTSIPEIVRNSTGVWWEGKWIAIVESIANICLNVLFVKYWGINGILLATILTMATINMPLETACVYKCYFKRDARRDVFKYFMNFLGDFGIVLFTWRICMGIDTKLSILSIILRFLFCSFLANSLWLLLHCRDGIIKKGWGLIKNVLLKQW